MIGWKKEKVELKNWEREGGGRGREGARRRRWKESGAEACSLEKLQVIRVLIDEEDGSVVVDLPNLGTQHVFILTELCYHCWGIFGLEIYCNK